MSRQTRAQRLWCMSGAMLLVRQRRGSGHGVHARANLHFFAACMYLLVCCVPLSVCVLSLHGMTVMGLHVQSEYLNLRISKAFHTFLWEFDMEVADPAPPTNRAAAGTPTAPG